MKLTFNDSENKPVLIFLKKEIIADWVVNESKLSIKFKKLQSVDKKKEEYFEWSFSKEIYQIQNWNEVRVFLDSLINKTKNNIQNTLF